MATTASLQARLDAVYHQLSVLRQESTPAEFEKFAQFFAEDCTAYLRSMREHAEPAIGRTAVVNHLKDILNDHDFDRRSVISQSVNEQESRVFCEMENRYMIHGQPLDPCHETAVVVFDADGLISNFKQYSCRSHIVMMIQRATGVGPYHDSIITLEA